MQRILPYGARTTHHLYKTCGPKPNWQHLQDDGLLRPYQNRTIGQIMALTAEARRQGKQRGLHVPYLNGPSVVVQAAVQADILEKLLKLGYQLEDIQYKGKPDALGRSNSPQGRLVNTSVVVRYVVRVPEQEIKAIESEIREKVHYPFRQLQQRKYDSNYKALKTYGPPIPGHPSLYVLTGSAESVNARLKTLEKRHRRDRETWRAPLLIGVLDELPHRSLVAALNAKYSYRSRAHLMYPDLIPPTPAIQLVTHPDHW